MSLYVAPQRSLSRALGAGAALVSVVLLGALFLLAASSRGGSPAGTPESLVPGLSPPPGAWARWVERTPEGTVAVRTRRASPAVFAVSTFPEYVRLSADEMVGRVEGLLPRVGRIVSRRWTSVSVETAMLPALETEYEMEGGRRVRQVAVPVPREGTNPVLVVARDLPEGEMEGALAGIQVPGVDIATRD